MSEGHIGTIITLICLIIMSAYFSSTETAFSSLNRIKLKNLAEQGNKKAEKALAMSDQYDKILSTILVGNNIVNIASASIATVLFTELWGEEIGIPVSTLIMTIVVLIFGEISPKSIAKDMPEKFAMWSAPILNVFCYILTPVNWFFTQWKIMLTKVFKVSDDRGVTEQEILTMVNEAQNEGGIDEEEGEMIRSVMEFDDLEVQDVLTPRVDVVFIEDTDDNDTIANIFAESGYSRIPVYHDDLDNIMGVLNQKDFFADMILHNENLLDTMASATFVSPGMKISKLMRLLQEKKSHLAIAVDEYGGVAGVITLEDILEELVGEIWDEHDAVIVEMRKVSATEYLVSGSASVDKLFEILDVDEKSDAVSVGGWVVQELGRIPEKGDTMGYENLMVTVTEANERKVSEVKIEVLEEEETEESQ